MLSDTNKIELYYIYSHNTIVLKTKKNIVKRLYNTMVARQRPQTYKLNFGAVYKICRVYYKNAILDSKRNSSVGIATVYMLERTTIQFIPILANLLNLNLICEKFSFYRNLVRKFGLYISICIHFICF